MQSNLNRGQNLLIKVWHDKAIRNVIDLQNAGGQLYHFNELKETPMICMELFILSVNSEKITCLWNNKINHNNVKCNNLKQNVAQNCYIQILCKDTKKVAGQFMIF